MRNYGDLNSLILFAREFAVGVTIHYSEVSEEMSIETTSPAIAEQYYEKRIISVEDFISSWKKHIGLGK